MTTFGSNSANTSFLVAIIPILLHPKQKAYSNSELSQSALLFIDSTTQVPSSFIYIDLIVDPISRRLFISSLTPKHKGQNGYGVFSFLKSVLSSLLVSLTTVGTVLTLNLSYSLSKNFSIR